MLHEKIPSLLINTERNMTEIKYIFFIRGRGAIEPCIFVEYVFIMFSTAVTSYNPSKERLIFNYYMGRVITIRRQEKYLCQIIRGGKSTDIIFRGNRHGNWEQIRGIACSFMRTGSIVNGDGRYINSWDTGIIFKGII